MLRIPVVLLFTAIATVLVPVRADSLQPCAANHPPIVHPDLAGADLTLLFSPLGGGERLIVAALDGAQHSVLMQAYSFTDRRIFKALERAVARGVRVQAIVDQSDTRRYHGRPSVAERLAAMHIPVWVDDTVETAHNKVLILDDADVITGSYNFTYAADERNAENLLYFRHAPALAQAYIADWNWRRGCSRRFEP